MPQRTPPQLRKPKAKAKPKTRIVGFRVTEMEYAVLESKARGNVSKYARARVFGRGLVLGGEAPAADGGDPTGPRSRNRELKFTLRLSEREDTLVERLARDGGYADRAAFVRARLFSPADVRLAGELGAIVQRVDEALSYDPGGDKSIEMLKSALKRVRADLLIAGAVTRS